MNFDFTEQEINLVLKALGAQPYVDVAGVIGKIMSQGQAQLAKAQPPAEPPKAE